MRLNPLVPFFSSVKLTCTSGCSLGAALLSLTAFMTFFRTLWWAMPAQSPELAKRCSRDTHIGQVLLVLSSTVFVAVCSMPDGRQYLVLALQMPFYLYFFTTAFGYVRRSKSWTVPENQPLLSEREAPWRRILYIAIFIEVILAVSCQNDSSSSCGSK